MRYIGNFEQRVSNSIQASLGVIRRRLLSDAGLVLIVASISEVLVETLREGKEVVLLGREATRQTGSILPQNS